MKYYKSASLKENIRWNTLDTSRRVKNFLVRLKYWYNDGYLCDECGVRIPIYYSEIHSVVNGKPMVISNCSDKLYCTHCLAEKIDTYFANAELESHACYWFPESTKTVDSIGLHSEHEKNYDLAKDLELNVRFGSGWWNGHYACNYAFQTALFSDKLKYRTGLSKYEDGKTIMVDRHGITMERMYG